MVKNLQILQEESQQEDLERTLSQALEPKRLLCIRVNLK